jgi:hypothetical protein
VVGQLPLPVETVDFIAAAVPELARRVLLGELQQLGLDQS